MNTEAPVAVVTPPQGVVAVRVMLFGSASEELRRALHPPWPRWMRRLYSMEERSSAGIDVSEGETTIPAALSALGNHLRHHLDLAAFVTQGLEDCGFELELDPPDAVLATARMTPAAARDLLDRQGVAGPMCAVCELDSSGWPRMWYGGDGA